MKICIISNLFRIYEGQQKLYTDMIAEGVARENEVVVITTRPFSGLGSLKPSVESRDNVRTYRFYPLNVYRHYPHRYRPLWIRLIWHLVEIWNPHPYFLVRRILKKEKPDVVHTINLLGMSASVFTAVKASGRPHVHTLTDGALLSPWASLLRNGEMVSFNFLDRQYIRIKRFLAKSVNVVLAISRFMRDIHLQHGYFKNRPFHVIDYPYRLPPARLKSKSYSPIDILFVGNVVYEKGIFLLLDAFRELERDGVNLHYVGRGADLEALKEAAQGLGNVYIHGFMTDEDLADMYSRANITVVPSLCFEAGPAAAFIESLPFGTPVVSSVVGGSHEGIVDGVNGRLFARGDSTALREILRDLIDRPDKLRQMETEALKSAEKYRPEKYIASLLKVYEDAKRGFLP